MHERFTRHTADNYNEMLHTRFRLCFVLYIYKYIHLIDGKRTSHAHQPPDSLFSFSQIPSSICENARPDQPVMVFRCREIEFRIIGNVSLQNREYFTFWLWRREATRARSIDWRRRWRKCNSVTIDVLRMNAAGALLLSVISIPCFLLLLLFFFCMWWWLWCAKRHLCSRALCIYLNLNDDNEGNSEIEFSSKIQYQSDAGWCAWKILNRKFAENANQEYTHSGGMRSGWQKI